MKAHCLFEQSGTFKNEFKKLGHEAWDYDIQNEFGETDYVIDLFAEIVGGYKGEPSIFDNIGKEDLILAFFPCTRFEARIPLWFRGQAQQQKKQSLTEKLIYAMNLHDELNLFYHRISQLVVLCIKKGLKFVIENPYTQPHYLTMYWAVQPALIDKDRTQNGDHYKKPTQYFFINFEPKQNILFEPIEYVETKVVGYTTAKDGKSRATMRSMIHPQYANRFIRQHILKQGDWDE